MRLWITRTEPAAGRLASAVGALAVDCLCQPLLRIEPLAPEPLPGFVDAAVVLSVHASAALPKLGIDAGRWLSVGRQSAEAAAKALKLPATMVDWPEDERSEGLLIKLRPIALSGGRIALVSGVGGREWLAVRLAELGADVVRRAVYQRVPEQIPAKPPSDLIEVSSVAALNALADLSRDRDAALLVASDRLAEEASAIGFQNVHNAGGADADALVAVLRDLLESQ